MSRKLALHQCDKPVAKSSLGPFVDRFVSPSLPAALFSLGQASLRMSSPRPGWERVELAGLSSIAFWTKLNWLETYGLQGDKRKTHIEGRIFRVGSLLEVPLKRRLFSRMSWISTISIPIHRLRQRSSIGPSVKDRRPTLLVADIDHDGKTTGTFQGHAGTISITKNTSNPQADPNTSCTWGTDGMTRLYDLRHPLPVLTVEGDTDGGSCSAVSAHPDGIPGEVFID